MKLTKLEMDFLNQILKSEYLEWISEKGFLGDWVCEPFYNMKTTRGVISSLLKKGVVDNGGNQKGFHGEEMIDGEEFEDLAGEYHIAHKTTTDSIKRILGSLARA